jgi:autotransporter passenger strand-loop-strand repeat protein
MVTVLAGGRAIGATLANGAQLQISSGGSASGTTIDGGGSEEFVFSGGVASGTAVSSGGFEEVGFFASGFQDLGGTTLSAVVSAGGLGMCGPQGTPARPPSPALGRR